MQISRFILSVFLLTVCGVVLGQDDDRKDWFFAVNVDGVFSEFQMKDFNKNILEPLEETWQLESTNLGYGFGSEIGLSLNQQYIEMAVDGLYLRRNIDGVKTQWNDTKTNVRFAVEGFAITHSIGVKLHNFGRDIHNIIQDEPKWNMTFRMKVGMAHTSVWREDHYVFADGEDVPYKWGQNRTTLTWAQEIDAGWKVTNTVSVHLGVGYRILPIGRFRRVEYTSLSLSEPDVKYRATLTGFYGSIGLSYRIAAKG